MSAPTPPVPHTSPLALATIGLICFATWMLKFGYAGLFHDAGLYALQALSHIRPETLGADVFIRFGSQDRFTIFSPIYASVIQGLGVDAAAAILTFLSQLALVACAFALARVLMPVSLTAVGVAVFIATPGGYGTDRIFTCLEPFLTARMLAEAITLGAFAAALASRRGLAILLTLFATTIHPLMAIAGIVAWFWLRTPRRSFVIALILAGLLAAALGGRFDPTWLDLIRDRSPYLFIAHWDLDAVSRAAVMLVTLALGAAPLAPCSRPLVRGAARAVLLTVLSGFALTSIACDALHLVLITQLQPWRWQWLGTVFAALLLPQILCTLWASEVRGRTAALLLIAAWVFASNGLALAAAFGSLLAIAFVQRLKPAESRWVLWGACGMLAIAAVWRVASNLQFTESHYMDAHIPLWFRNAISFTSDGAIPGAAIALVWWLGRRRRDRQPYRTGASIVAGMLALLACMTLLPQTWARWTMREYPTDEVARFAPLRARIPPNSEVFWPGSPLAVWLLLDRPSYLSVIQTSGMVFSRATAIELKRRADALASSVDARAFMSWATTGTGLNMSKHQLEQACSTGTFEFLVTAAELAQEPTASLPTASLPTASLPTASKTIRLYRCPAPDAPS